VPGAGSERNIASRIAAVDLVRGLALGGMLVANLG
jgi:uncharacterized membrane protein YeiB